VHSLSLLWASSSSGHHKVKKALYSLDWRFSGHPAILHLLAEGNTSTPARDSKPCPPDTCFIRDIASRSSIQGRSLAPFHSRREPSHNSSSAYMCQSSCCSWIISSILKFYIELHCMLYCYMHGHTSCVQKHILKFHVTPPHPVSHVKSD
jgi:hypothetical protein